MSDAPALTVADRLAIGELLLRYGRSLDARDAAGYAALFTPDAVRASERTGTVVGRAAIQRVAQDAIDSWAVDVRHFTGQPTIDGDAQRCRVRSYCQVLVQVPDGPVAIAQVALYADVCVKLDGHWFFAERAVTELLSGHDTLKRHPTA